MVRLFKHILRYIRISHKSLESSELATKDIISVRGQWGEYISKENRMTINLEIFLEINHKNDTNSEECALTWRITLFYNPVYFFIFEGQTTSRKRAIAARASLANQKITFASDK